jgi:excisionase family DNA binding protein
MKAVEENIGYVTVQQAAKMVGVHRGAIYQAIGSGKLKPVKVLGHMVLRLAEVQAYQPRNYAGRRRVKDSALETDALAGSIGYELPVELLQRYHELLDQKFGDGLSGEEEWELEQVGTALDTADMATPLEFEGANRAAALHQQRLQTLDDVIVQLKSLLE